MAANTPSPNILVVTASLYPFAPAQDADAGTDPAGNYPATPTATFRCLPQCVSSEAVGEDGRVTTLNTWLILSGVNPGTKARDRLSFAAPDGTAHTVLADGPAMDAGGQGVAWELPATERV